MKGGGRREKGGGMVFVRYIIVMLIFNFGTKTIYRYLQIAKKMIKYI